MTAQTHLNRSDTSRACHRRQRRSHQSGDASGLEVGLTSLLPFPDKLSHCDRLDSLQGSGQSHRVHGTGRHLTKNRSHQDKDPVGCELHSGQLWHSGHLPPPRPAAQHLKVSGKSPSLPVTDPPTPGQRKLLRSHLTFSWPVVISLRARPLGIC